MSVDSWFPSTRSGLTLGSLFSGVAGLDLGVEAAFAGNLKTIWQVEQNAYCTKVLAEHWPEATRYGDIRGVDTRQLRRVDIITAGFPCQDASVSGKRAGLVGTRSGLWSEAARIIRDVRPRICIIENVPGVLSPIRVAGRVVEQAPIATVLGDLSALGFNAWWDSLRGTDVGAPEVRERVFIVAYAARVGLEESLASSQSDQREAAARSRRSAAGARTALSDLVRSVDGSAAGLDAHLWPARQGRPQVASEPPRSAFGVANRKERIMALGNGVIPHCAFVAGCVAREILARM